MNISLKFPEALGPNDSFGHSNNGSMIDRSGPFLFFKIISQQDLF